MILSLVLVGCGTGRIDDGQGSTSPQPSRSPSPQRTSNVAADVEVAVPTCSTPEVKPSWWTPYCGDAGWQLNLSWDDWTPQSARAHGTAIVTHGNLDGQTWTIRVTFDRPVRVRGFKPRKLFSRAVVHYLNRRGPNGKSVETMSLKHVWETAEWITSQPDDCPSTTADGVACGDSEDPSQLMASPSPSTS